MVKGFVYRVKISVPSGSKARQKTFVRNFPTDLLNNTQYTQSCGIELINVEMFV